MIKGLLFFVRFSWKHEKKYLIYRILNQFVSSMIPMVAVIMPRWIINELMEERRTAYLMLDIAIDIIGKAFTMIGVIAVVASLNPMIVLAFIALVFLSSLFESHVQKKQAGMRLEMTVLNRRTMYYSEIMEDFSYGKEIRINNLGNWLTSREKEHWDRGFQLYRRNNQLGIQSGVFNAFTGLIQQIVSVRVFVML